MKTRYGNHHPGTRAGTAGEESILGRMTERVDPHVASIVSSLARLETRAVSLVMFSGGFPLFFAPEQLVGGGSSHIVWSRDS